MVKGVITRYMDEVRIVKEPTDKCKMCQNNGPIGSIVVKANLGQLETMQPTISIPFFG